ARVRDDRVDRLDRAHGLPDEFLYALARDSEGNLWIGTSAGGVVRLKNGVFAPFGTREGLSHDVAYPVYEDARGRVLVGTKQGVDRLENGRFVPAFPP